MHTDLAIARQFLDGGLLLCPVQYVRKIVEQLGRDFSLCRASGQKEGDEN